MPLQGSTVYARYVAWNKTTGQPVAGDSANHTINWIGDGTSTAVGTPVIVDEGNGAYHVTIAGTLTGAIASGHVQGTSSTSNVILNGIEYGFEPMAGRISSGTAQAGGTQTITLAAAEPATLNLYQFCVVQITGGTGKGGVGTIASYSTGRVATMTAPWAVTLDSTSTYSIFMQGAVVVGQILPAAAAAIATALGPSINYVGTVSPGGLISVTQGMAYAEAAGTEIGPFPVPLASFDLTGLTVVLTLTLNPGGNTGASSMVLTGTVVNAGELGQAVYFEMTAAQSAMLAADPSNPHTFRPAADSYAYTYLIATSISSNCTEMLMGSCSVTANSAGCT